MMSAKKSQNASLLVQDFEHLKPVNKLENLVIPMKSYDLVLDVSWGTRKQTGAEVEWQPYQR